MARGPIPRREESGEPCPKVIGSIPERVANACSRNAWSAASQSRPEFIGQVLEVHVADQVGDHRFARSPRRGDKTGAIPARVGKVIGHQQLEFVELKVRQYRAHFPRSWAQFSRSKVTESRGRFTFTATTRGLSSPNCNTRASLGNENACAIES